MVDMSGCEWQAASTVAKVRKKKKSRNGASRPAFAGVSDPGSGDGWPLLAPLRQGEDVGPTRIFLGPGAALPLQ